MKGNRMSTKQLIKPAGLFILFLICSVLIFVLGSPYYSIFPTNTSGLYKISLSIIFLAATLLLYANERLKRYWQVSYTFFVASFANWLLGTELFRLPGSSPDTVQGMAVDKISQLLAIVPAIIVLTLIVRVTLGSIYLKKGKLRLGLIIGLTAFIVFSVLGILQGMGHNIGFATIGSWAPWLLIFSLSNGLLEELWFRGIFLKRFEALLGSKASLLLTSIVFAAAHVGATYISSEITIFLVVVFVLGLAFGYVMQKTDSLLASVLFHAGVDLWYIIGTGIAATQH